MLRVSAAPSLLLHPRSDLRSEGLPTPLSFKAISSRKSCLGFCFSEADRGGGCGGGFWGRATLVTPMKGILLLFSLLPFKREKNKF